MGKNFRPHIYQRARDRAQSKEPIQVYDNSPYHILHLPHLSKPLTWFWKTKKSEFTDLFLIGFKFDTDTNQIYAVLKNEFGEQIDKIIRIPAYLYEIQLNEMITWEEVFNRVHQALDGVVFDVIG